MQARKIPGLPALLILSTCCLAAAEPRGTRTFTAAWGEASVSVLSGASDSSAAVTVASLVDFTLVPDSLQAAEAHLEMSFRDFASGQRLQFPLKYSQLRRFLSKRSGDYQHPDRNERNLALIRDLSTQLRIRMLPRGNSGGKEP